MQKFVYEKNKLLSNFDTNFIRKYLHKDGCYTISSVFDEQNDGKRMRIESIGNNKEGRHIERTYSVKRCLPGTLNIYSFKLGKKDGPQFCQESMGSKSVSVEVYEEGRRQRWMTRKEIREYRIPEY